MQEEIEPLTQFTIEITTIFKLCELQKMEAQVMGQNFFAFHLHYLPKMVRAVIFGEEIKGQHIYADYRMNNGIVIAFFKLRADIMRGIVKCAQ